MLEDEVVEASVLCESRHFTEITKGFMYGASATSCGDSTSIPSLVGNHQLTQM
jgi:hypothetical protein